MKGSFFSKICLTSVLLALVVIVLGAYVRLSDAGLGCPDWPGCYGQFSAPDNMEEITRAELLYPHKAVESDKAWKEMLHRYLASTLGLLIVTMAFVAWKNRNFIDQQLLLPTILVALVIFQGMLGMWTVTHLLKPTIVTLHLLTGLLTLSLLFWCYLKSQTILWYRQPINKSLRTWSRLALIILAIQLFLGGWTSTHYVALYCPDFPTCQGQWMPEMNFRDAFVLIQQSGVNYEGGVLSEAAIALDARFGFSQANGSAVSTWEDRTNNNKDASQATAANQPSYTSNGLNGSPVVTFDGANTPNQDFLEVASITVNQPITVITI